ncbi:glycosyltransferase family 2 protein, partial [Enterobacter sp. PR-089-C-ECC]
MKLFVAAIIKNEMDALLEWIAYHRVVGVSGFIIADNGSNDGSRAFLDGLEKLGIVSVLDFPDVEGQKPQLPAYERILRTCSTDIDLLAFIDADEFLVPLDPE